MTFRKGISAYIGMEYTLDDNIRYLHIAAGYGYNLLFTSLHIPEADSVSLLHDFGKFTQIARDCGYRVVADISPRSFRMLGASLDNLDPLRALAVDVWRFDFGFTIQEIADFAENGRFHIQINTSTTDKRALKALLRTRLKANNIESCHNFYPREETGLSYELFYERSLEFRKQGIPVFAFIPSHSNPRGPIYAGLPTIEEHRCLSPVIAAKHIIASGVCNGVIFGDPMVSEDELRAVGALSTDCISLRCHIEPSASLSEREILLSTRHTNRFDPGRYVLRSEESRGLYNSGERIAIEPCNNCARMRGMVTVDNNAYGRYMGELQLVTQDLPADSRVNVVARVIEEEQFLIDLIRPGQAFCFRKKSFESE